MSEGPPRIDAFGDAALLVTFGEAVDGPANRSGHALAAAVASLRAADSRYGRPVPAYAGVLVPFDPLALPPPEARATVAGLAAQVARTAAAGGSGSVREAHREGRLVEIPVRYGGDDGPDLGPVAEALGLTLDGVVALHTGSTYDVYFLGFAPGFAYLGPLPASLEAPRLDSPRLQVPAGSVAIAGRQTAVYPSAMPGGWRLIGRTQTRLWDIGREPPAVLAAGDRVRFVRAP